MDAATIEETNRIRVSLGMKPLPVPGADATNDHAASEPESDEDPGSNIETREAQGQDNYKKYQEAEAAKRRREEKSAAVRRARELAQRNLVLEGKGLGEEEEGGDVDAKSWLTGQKKRQKKIDKARKLEEELAAAEAAAAAAVQYTSKDLAGIKVGHDMSSFLDGDEQVLTLKDSAIDANDEEDDELENVGMREQESLQNKLDLLKKKPGYNPMNDEEAGGILSQYDEEINGKKRKRFTLDTDGMNAELADILQEPEQKQKKPQNVSLDDIVSGGAPASSDYLDASEIKMKKPKKKKSKHTRQKQYDDDLFAPEAVEANGDAMDVDNKATARKTQKTESDTFVDDDDLQASLAAQRRNALKKRKKGRPEDVAKQLREQGETLDEDQNQGGGNAEGGLVIGAVSEFVSGLSKPEDEEERKPKKARSRTKEPEPDTEMKTEPEEDQAMENAPTEAYKQESPQPDKDEGEAENEEEKMVGSGMGAALSLLRERGLVEESQGDEQYESFRKRQVFLAKKRMLEEELDEQTRQQRERDRASGRLDRMSVREREDYARQQNQWRDQQQSRRMAELFEANYQPKVDLKYVDDHGRSLDQKGAFKHLSHHFHGKGSGKGKTEKLLKKIDEEKRRGAQSMFDASESTGMGRATAQQLKKRKEAGVRLG
jgi:U4/U6.U5 tri-snRNP-associated protein 1